MGFKVNDRGTVIYDLLEAGHLEEEHRGEADLHHNHVMLSNFDQTC